MKLSYKNIRVGLYHKKHFHTLLAILRPEDIQELHCIGSLSGYSWQQSFARTLALSSTKYAVYIDEQCHGVFGVRSYKNKHYASVWFLCSTKLTQYPSAIVYLAPKVLATLHVSFPFLMNCISVESLQFVRPFLRYCKMTIDTKPLQLQGVTMYMCSSKRYSII